MNRYYKQKMLVLIESKLEQLYKDLKRFETRRKYYDRTKANWDELFNSNDINTKRYRREFKELKTDIEDYIEIQYELESEIKLINTENAST